MSEIFDPHPYQKRGIDLLTSRRSAALVLDPGLGKTAIALAAYQRLKDSNAVDRMLVIAPIRPMYDTWPAEMKKWDQFEGLRVAIVHGPNRLKAAMSDADIYLINPEGLFWLEEQANFLWERISVLCIDESTKFKNSQAKRFKLLVKKVWLMQYRWILTGTIAPNGLEDLFGQYRLCDGGERLGLYVTRFRRKYFIPPHPGGFNWTPREGAQEEITEAVKDISLQLSAADHLKMPTLMQITRPVTLPPKVMDQYRELEKEFILELDDDTITAGGAAIVGNKLRQLVGGALYNKERQTKIVDDAKLQALDEIIEETNGHPLLLIYEYRHEAARMAARLPDRSYQYLERAGSVEDFNAGRIRYLLAHPGSLHGINIQAACHHMVWYTLPWNLEHYLQANGRLYRQGQRSNHIFCYYLTARDTIDERVFDVLKDKNATQDDINASLRAPELEKAS